jgi:uncharacterized protein (TIGR04255 family)
VQEIVLQPEVPLPSYQNPPVIEVACGVQFEPIESMLVPHVGQLWNEFQSEFPKIEEHTPLGWQMEIFDSQPPANSPTLQFLDTAVLPRVWFVSADNAAVIQVQRDRFLYNWRKTTSTQAYPRYGSVKSTFKNSLSRFERFIENRGLGTIKVRQYEMTYVNHIFQGDGWSDLGDLGELFPDFVRRRDTARFLPANESIVWRNVFVLPEKQGRLRVTIQDATRREDSRRLIVLELLARGINPSSPGLDDWFDTARECIVRGFTDLTHPHVQRAVWLRNS